MSSLYEQFLAVGSVKSLLSGREFSPLRETENTNQLQTAFEKAPGDASFKRMQKIQRLVEESQVGTQVLEAAKKTGTRFCLDNSLTECSGFFSIESNAIFLNARESNAFLATTLVHEARHAWQATQPLDFTQGLDTKSFFMMGFAIEADAVSKEAHFASDIKSKHPEIWQVLMNDKYSCVAEAFENGTRQRNMVRDGLDSAFQAWYSVSSVPLYAEDYVDFLANASQGVDGQRPSFLSISASSEKIARTVCTFNGETYLKNPSIMETPEKLHLSSEQKEKLDKAITIWATNNRRFDSVGTEAIFVLNPDGSYAPGQKLDIKRPESASLFKRPYRGNQGR